MTAEAAAEVSRHLSEWSTRFVIARCELQSACSRWPGEPALAGVRPMAMQVGAEAGEKKKKIVKKVVKKVRPSSQVVAWRFPSSVFWFKS